MVNPTIIAAAQICAEDENVDHNLIAHYKLIRLAAAHGVRLLVFPEMSVTGYVREAAKRLAFSPMDPRLDELRRLAALYDMTIIAGAPVRLGAALHIGSFILQPDRSVLLYTKQFLYEGENDFYMPSCGNNPLISLDREQVSPAVCFDIENAPHIRKAKESGSTVYAASIFYSESSIEQAHELLSGYAKGYSLCVLMANFSGRMYHAVSGGGSAFWNGNGELLAGLGRGHTGLVVGIREDGVWRGMTVPDESDVYTCCPKYVKSTVTLRKTEPKDTGELLKCYSDEKAVPLFNSDNCNGDDFHYTTPERMRQAIELWDYFYNTRNFVRWTVVVNTTGEPIGTIEMYGRSTDGALGRFGILRIDLRSDFETKPVIKEILEIADEYFFEAFEVRSILTKAVPAASERLSVLAESGYSPLEENLMKFGDYYIHRMNWPCLCT